MVGRLGREGKGCRIGLSVIAGAAALVFTNGLAGAGGFRAAPRPSYHPSHHPSVPPTRPGYEHLTPRPPYEIPPLHPSAFERLYDPDTLRIRPELRQAEASPADPPPDPGVEVKESLERLREDSINATGDELYVKAAEFGLTLNQLKSVDSSIDPRWETYRAQLAERVVRQQLGDAEIMIISDDARIRARAEQKAATAIADAKRLGLIDVEGQWRAHLNDLVQAGRSFDRILKIERSSTKESAQGHDTRAPDPTLYRFFPAWERVRSRTDDVVWKETESR